MPMDQFLHGLHPYRANDNALYPAGECRWESFAKDIVRAIHIRVNGQTLSRDELSAPDPLPQRLGMLADGLQIQERALRGIVLFLDDHLDPGQLGFVLEHVDKGNGSC